MFGLMASSGGNARFRADHWSTPGGFQTDPLPLASELPGLWFVYPENKLFLVSSHAEMIYIYPESLNYSRKTADRVRNPRAHRIIFIWIKKDGAQTSSKQELSHNKMLKGAFNPPTVCLTEGSRAVSPLPWTRRQTQIRNKGTPQHFQSSLIHAIVCLVPFNLFN